MNEHDLPADRERRGGEVRNTHILLEDVLSRSLISRDFHSSDLTRSYLLPFHLDHKMHSSLLLQSFKTIYVPPD